VVGSVHRITSGVDPPNHWIKHERTRSLGGLPKEGCRSHLGAAHKRNLRGCGEREAGLQGILHPKWCNVPSLPFDR
jgi:hypothetical protein